METEIMLQKLRGYSWIGAIIRALFSPLEMVLRYLALSDDTRRIIYFSAFYVTAITLLLYLAYALIFL